MRQFTSLMGLAPVCCFSATAAGQTLISTTPTFSTPTSTSPIPSLSPTSRPYPRGPPPKVFPSSIRDIPDKDFRCWTSHVSYSSASASIFYAEDSEKLIFTSFPLVTTVYGNYVQVLPEPDTTLCDGFPRVTGRQTPTGYAPLMTETISSTWYSTWYPPTPTCTADNFGSVCSKMHVSMTSIASRIKIAGFSTDFPLDEGDGITEVLKPPCQTLDAYPTGPTPVTCSLGDKKLTYKVLYWPPEHTTEQPCTLTNISRPLITPAPTVSNDIRTARYGDLTLTSPTVYYILENAQMATFAGMTGRNRTSAYLPLGSPYPTPITLSQNPDSTPLSSAISSCSNHGRGPCTWLLQPFSLQDLLTVPADKYYSRIGGFMPIYQGWYTPRYTFPQDILTKAGVETQQWRECEVLERGAAEPKYLAVPTERYSWINEAWTWEGPVETGRR